MDLRLTGMGLRRGNVTLPCSIGRGGVTGDKREGDMATPRGVLTITGCLYRPDRLARPAPWAEPILTGDLWCDDPHDPAYNLHVRAPFGAGHERLRLADPRYDIVLTTDWNWPLAEPAKGSAIFVHQWRRPGYPTAGCIALSRLHLRWLAARAAPGSRILVP